MMSHATKFYELWRLLTTPALYLRIKNSRKQRIDVVAPLFALLFGLPLFMGFNHLNLFGEYGLVHGVSGLLQVLTGFFITALAAIATFPGTTAYPVDVSLTGEGASIIHGKEDEEPLSRRRFLCLMFGYLAMISLILYVVGVFCMMVGPNLHAAVAGHPVWIRLIPRGIFLLIYLPLLGHMMATTLLGLAFLSDRIPKGSTQQKAIAIACDNEDG